MTAELSLYEIDLNTELESDSIQLLSVQEREFATTIRNPSLQKQHLKVRVGLRQILAIATHQPANKIAIAKTEYGKPYLQDFSELEFNLSHSGNTLLVAISRIGTVGVDIEQAKKQNRDFSGLVAKCFAQSEQEYWHSLPEFKKTAEFYRFWTRKEAFVKATGRGVALGLQSCVLAGEGRAYFMNIPTEYGSAADWQLFDLSLKPDLYGAVVVKAKQLSNDFSLPKIMPFVLD